MLLSLLDWCADDEFAAPGPGRITGDREADHGRTELRADLLLESVAGAARGLVEEVAEGLNLFVGEATEEGTLGFGEGSCGRLDQVAAQVGQVGAHDAAVVFAPRPGDERRLFQAIQQAGHVGDVI